MASDLGLDAGPRCNIGPAELRRRRSVAVALTLLTAAVALALGTLAVPHVARLALWPFAAAAGVTWLQVTRRFCVRFGLMGLENFGRLGGERRVASDRAAADQRQAIRQIGEGLLAGLLVTAVFMALPV